MKTEDLKISVEDKVATFTFNRPDNSDFKTILDREALTHLRCGQTEDHKEGVAAFMEKRQPNFKGR